MELKINDRVRFKATGDVGTITKVWAPGGMVTHVQVCWDAGTGWAEYEASRFELLR